MASPSPFSALLGTNYSPNDSELAAVRTYIAQRTTHFYSLKQQIESLQQALCALVPDAEAARADVVAHTKLVAPIHRIPVEILQRIFVECLPANRNCVMSATEPPMLFGRVSSGWRRAAYSDPRLWTRLHVDFPAFNWRTLSSPRQTIERMVGVAGELPGLDKVDYVLGINEKRNRLLSAVCWWLDKTGNCPLSISAAIEADPEPLVTVLAQYASRWDVVALKAMDGSILSSLLTLPDGAVPWLTSLSIYEHGPIDMIEGNATIFHGQNTSDALRSRLPVSGELWNAANAIRAPHLRRLELVSPLIKPLELPITWRQLTTLRLDAKRNRSAMTSNGVVAVLKRSPQLREFDVSIRDRASTEFNQDCIVHQNLQSLRLVYSSLTRLGPFAALGDRLRLPALRRFELIGDIKGVGARVLSSSFSQHFVAKAMLLHSVRVTIGLFTQPELNDFLAHLPPSVHSLHFPAYVPQEGDQGRVLHERGARLDGAVLQGLSPPALPQLREIVIDSPVNVFDDDLVRFVDQRLGSLKRVRVVYATASPGPYARRGVAATRLHALEHGAVPGLQLELVCSPRPRPNIRFVPVRS
ncbi:F-box domain-containing protein [Mycena kentingensis (nom. inval.)]|nr:F-box domain-containing protein [Mycena kentingensis (nom. inval.)]